jgi:ParB family chromosome partitioning protein
MHRLAAMRALGAQSITALVLPDPEIQFRILALNTEKAHNLRDKSLEVVRMAKALAADPATAKKTEADFAFEFEVPAYLTIGLCYEENGRFSGGAYLPVVSRCEEFSDATLVKAMPERKRRAERLLELDAAVNEVVGKLKEAGLKSAYLKPFVIARINPLRFQKPAKPGQKAPRAEFDATLDKMLASAQKFDAAKVRPQDLAAMAAYSAPPAEE